MVLFQKFKEFGANKLENINIFFYKFVKKNNRVPLGKLCLFSFLLVVLGWFVFKALFAINGYTALTENIPCEIINVCVKERGSNRFVVLAEMKILQEGVVMQVSAPLPKNYPNRFAAQQALEKKEFFPDRLWRNPRQPTQIVFEKHFPWKELSSAAVVFLLELYCVFLGVYVIKKERTTRA